MAAILLALYVGDHPALFSRVRSHVMNLGRAFTDEAALTGYLGHVLDAKILGVVVRKVDLVNDTTSIEVRYEVHSGTHGDTCSQRLTGSDGSEPARTTVWSSGGTQ